LTAHLSILDTIAPRIGHSRRRIKKQLLAKTGFYVSVAAFAVFAGVSYFLFDKDRTVPEIPATQTEAEVIGETKAYLEKITHFGLKLQDPETTCAETFKDAEFKAEYLLYGSWRINAYYSGVRYFWRVDDASLEVTQDNFLKTLNDRITC
jgi:aspartyl/asparaginyl beta-hydroxylase (cupin superfamily)